MNWLETTSVHKAGHLRSTPVSSTTAEKHHKNNNTYFFQCVFVSVTFKRPVHRRSLTSSLRWLTERCMIIAHLCPLPQIWYRYGEPLSTNWFCRNLRCLRVQARADDGYCRHLFCLRLAVVLLHMVLRGLHLRAALSRMALQLTCLQRLLWFQDVDMYFVKWMSSVKIFSQVACVFPMPCQGLLYHRAAVSIQQPETC